MPGIWTSRGSFSRVQPGWVVADALNDVAGRRRATRGQQPLKELVRSECATVVGREARPVLRTGKPYRDATTARSFQAVFSAEMFSEPSTTRVSVAR